MTSVHPTLSDAAGSPPQLPQQIALGLGSNLGDRLAHLRRGLAHLRQHMRLMAVSGVYETEPIGFTDQPKFLNAVALFETAASPQQVLAWAQQAEHAEHRERGVHWGPRTLDVDVLMFGSLVLVSPDLVVPHALMHERAFVLAPLAELAPDWVHPSRGLTVAALLGAVKTQGVNRLLDAGWEGVDVREGG